MTDVVLALLDLIAFATLVAALSVVGFVAICLSLMALSGLSRVTSRLVFWLVLAAAVAAATVVLGSSGPRDLTELPQRLHVTTTTYPGETSTTSTTLFPCDEGPFDLPGLVNPCHRTHI